ncbi:hypothetical protein P8452_35562 [Trifolium repens]|nr:hypothetical protein P8452_35562 [Trifolium repens]
MQMPKAMYFLVLKRNLWMLAQKLFVSVLFLEKMHILCMRASIKTCSIFCKFDQQLLQLNQVYSIISSLQEIMDLGCELFGGSQTCKGVNGDLLVGVWRAMRQHGFRCF